MPATRIQLGVEEPADELPERNVGKSILYAGKLQRSKGLDTLFSVAEKLTDITIHLCGRGPLEKKSERVAEKNETVEYHGFVSNDRLEELRSKAAAVVVPSIWMENSPMVIYESFASGTPVIGANIGGIPELVEHDVRGALFSPGDGDDLLEKIRHVVDPANNRRLRESALEWARSRTLSRHVDRLETCYGID